MAISYAELLNNSRIDDNTPIPDDNIYLVTDQNILGTAGNFVSFTGLPGASKSTIMCALIASHISNGQILGFKTLSNYPDKNRLALFDTEQMGFDLQRKIKIIKRLSGTSKIWDRFDMFSVVEYEGKTIMQLIVTYLKNTPECAILIIDGLLDVVNGMFNDEKESTKLIRSLRTIAKKFNILIVTVLHLGKKDNLALGHLGSASTRYCQSEIEISKTKEQTYKCIAKKTRSCAGFDDIEYKYSEIEKRFTLI